MLDWNRNTIKIRKNSYHIVLATFGVRCDSRFVLDVQYEKFTKLLIAPRTCTMQISSYYILKLIYKYIHDAREQNASNSDHFTVLFFLITWFLF